ncbi:helix-turn-helix domain-containing protein [Streptomyces sp. NPDC090442]|uniref:helix-turn-helix domain-containing protein n=1 Tax=Streptomyces sp. NPDC090442 TaxID=3365962 RepID=UPI00381DEC68
MSANDLIEAAQQGDREAIEAILRELETMTDYLAIDRAKRMPGGNDSLEDLKQESRLAIWRAIKDYTPGEGAFTTYAYDVAYRRVQDESLRAQAPGIAKSAAAAYAGALGRNKGDHDEAVAELTALADSKRRFSAEQAEHVRRAFEGTVSMDTPGTGVYDAGAAVGVPVDSPLGRDAGMYNFGALVQESTESTDPSVWAESQGDLPDHMCYPLDLSRDAIRAKGVQTTGGKDMANPVAPRKGRADRTDFNQRIGQGKGEAKDGQGALIDRDAEAETRARYLGAVQVKAAIVLDLMSPSERQVLELAYGIGGASPLLNDKGSPDLHAIAEALGKTHNTVNVTLKRARAKARKAREAGEI